MRVPMNCPKKRILIQKKCIFDLLWAEAASCIGMCGSGGNHGDQGILNMQKNTSNLKV
jgi:hypothetical protein